MLPRHPHRCPTSHNGVGWDRDHDVSEKRSPTAEKPAAAGDTVVVADRTSRLPRRSPTSCGGGDGTAHARVIDVAEDQAVEDLFDDIETAVGSG